MWYWSIYILNMRGPLPQDVLCRVLPRIFEVAKAVFKAKLGKAARSHDGEAVRLWLALDLQPVDA
jgi:hypothetical protein